jgi:hypothetical protein
MSKIKVDTISERTSANGVVVDGVTIKDSGLTIPSGGTLTIDSGGTITNNGTASGFGLFTSYAVIADQKTSGTEGGSSVTGAFYTRDLNTEISDPDGIVSISSNQFTLGAGTYYIVWEAPFFGTGATRTRLANITDSTYSYSKSDYSASTNNGTQWVGGTARITLASSKVFEIQYRCATARATTGLGNMNNFGDVEQYTTIEIFKEA